MSAKHKLNQFHLLGSVLMAGLIGGVTGSWAVFWVTLVGFLVARYHAGDMRR